MTEQQRWVTIPVPSDPEENGGYTVGTSWQVSEGLKNAGRTYTVTGWGRSVRANEHERECHGDPVTCLYGEECDNLVDDEGPVGRFTDQDAGDETLKWYPGQSMGCLEPVEVDNGH